MSAADSRPGGIPATGPAPPAGDAATDRPGRPLRSRLYVGRLVHRRFEPRAHRFSYPVYYHLFDLDELDSLPRRLRAFGYNRPAPVAFYDADHLGGPGRPMRLKLEEFLRRQGVVPPGGQVLLLTQPRIFGYVFNPVSFFYCHDREGRLELIVAEVNNTFGERHAYVLDSSRWIPAERRRRAGHAGPAYAAMKELYVSPFVGMEARWDFYFTPPGEALSIHMDDWGPNGKVLDATLSGRARPLTTLNLFRLLAVLPFMTLQIIGRIHWQALRLWLKKVPHFPYTPRGTRETP